MDETIEVIIRMVPKEKAAYELYHSAAAKAATEASRLLLKYLADQEKDHETKLLAILQLLQKERAEMV